MEECEQKNKGLQDRLIKTDTREKELTTLQYSMGKSTT
jgi:hypothetical protein